MNTPVHLIVGAGFFGRPEKRLETSAALFGALLPDMSLYLMASWSIFVAGVSPNVVFGQYYYSSTWQQVFAVDNSFVLWGIGLGVAIWAKSRVFVAFCGAGMLHLMLDFPFHHLDARKHFWPLTDWVFVSPLSYWDNRYHAGVVGKIEFSLALVFCAVLFRRFRSVASRGVIVLALALEILATGIFRWLL